MLFPVLCCPSEAFYLFIPLIFVCVNHLRINLIRASPHWLSRNERRGWLMFAELRSLVECFPSVFPLGLKVNSTTPADCHLISNQQSSTCFAGFDRAYCEDYFESVRSQEVKLSKLMKFYGMLENTVQLYSSTFLNLRCKKHFCNCVAYSPTLHSR